MYPSRRGCLSFGRNSNNTSCGLDYWEDTEKYIEAFTERTLLYELTWREVIYVFGEGNGDPLQYSCLENPVDGRRSLVGFSSWGRRAGHDWATSLHFSVYLGTDSDSWLESSSLGRNYYFWRWMAWAWDKGKEGTRNSPSPYCSHDRARLEI